MIRLIIGIIFIVLPILTWFDTSLHFVEVLGATLFFWAIGIILIIVGADKITPGGIWKTKSIGDSSGGTEYERHYEYDAKGNLTGYTEVPKK